MSITFKILLSTRRANPQQQYPVILRVYKGTYYKEQSLNVKIVEADWDATNQKVLPSCTDHEAYNTKILSVKSKVQKQILLEDRCAVALSRHRSRQNAAGNNVSNAHSHHLNVVTLPQDQRFGLSCSMRSLSGRTPALTVSL